jgi:membrane associated rhomboid family serine protease
MLPLRDTVPARRLPAAVWALVFVNAAIFLHEAQLTPPELEQFVYRYGMIPARLTMPEGLERFWPTVITSMFLHGGWLHIIGNMWFLWVFGDNVEDRLGTVRFLVFYFLGGLAATVLHVFVAPHSTVPAVGASGAISAVLGAYLVLFPAARVITLVPIFFFPWFVEVPALLWIGLWFLEQWLNGVVALNVAPDGGGVAWWAHIGGFLFGVLAALPFAWAWGQRAERVPGAVRGTNRRRQFYYGYDREWPFV